MKRVKTIIYLLLPIFLTMGCKKKTLEVTTMNLRIKNHVVTSETSGLSGIQINLWKRNKKNGLKEHLWRGITDENGKVSYKHTEYSNDKVEYYYEYSRSQIEAYVNGSGNPCSCPQRKILPANQNNNRVLVKNQVNDIEVNYASFTIHSIKFVNAGCTDANDRFRFRKKYMNIKEGWSEWSSDRYGCNMSGDSEMTYNDSVIYQYEIERNGLLNVYQDTFYTIFNHTDTLYY